MHVAVDMRIVDAPGMELSGVGRYALEVTRALRRARPSWRLTVFSNRPQLLELDESVDVRGTRWPTASSSGRVGWLHVWSALTARPAADAWFSPAFVLPLWWRGAAIVTVHDLTFQLMPDRYRGAMNAAYASRATRWSARRADRVLCGSQETKSLLVRHIGVEPDRVRVTPYGVSERFAVPRPPAESGDGYLLFVGSFEARKGLDALHAALRDVNRSGRRVRLVLAGRPGWGAETELKAMRGDSAVELVIGPSDEALAALYRRALALVYPSRMEGFGLPVAEALAAGCPVIASDLACIREFAEDVPLYVRPGDSGGLARQIGLVLDRPELRAAMSRRGPEAVAALRWPAVGERTAREIESALGLRASPQGEPASVS